MTNNGTVTFDSGGGNFSSSNWLSCTKTWPSVFCLTGWFKNNNGAGSILGAADSNGYYTLSLYNDASNNKICVSIHGGTLKIYTTTPIDTSWHFFVIRGYSSGSNTWEFWFDGVSVGTGTVSFALCTLFSLRRMGAYANDHWDGGRIRDTRIYDHALSNDEISNLYVDGLNSYVNKRKKFFQNPTIILTTNYFNRGF
jgi:hypothetical protein